MAGAHRSCSCRHRFWGCLEAQGPPDSIRGGLALWRFKRKQLKAKEGKEAPPRACSSPFMALPLVPGPRPTGPASLPGSNLLLQPALPGLQEACSTGNQPALYFSLRSGAHLCKIGARGAGWSPIQINPRIYSAQEGVKSQADEMTVASLISNGRNLECDFGEKETCEKHKASWFSPPGCGPCLEKMELTRSQELSHLHACLAYTSSRCILAVT